MDNCKHVSRITPATDHSILNPQKWMCSECGTTESVWACMSCSHVACGRYNKEHALKHYYDTKHPLALEVNEKYVYCYVCDDYVLNDNAAGDLKILRSALSAIATQSFHDIEARGRRILRSHSFHGFDNRLEDDKYLRDQDINYTALWFRRMMLLGKTFNVWRQYTCHARKSVSSQAGQQGELLVAESSSSSLSWTKRALIPGITGLRNLGNTCYMNSILQVLSHLHEFRQLFLTQIREPNSNNSGGATLKTGKAPNLRQYKRQTTMECFQYASSSKGGRGGLNGGGSSTSPSPQQKHSITNSSGNDNVSLCHELHALLRVLWSGKWAILSPNAMLHAVWKIIPFFKGYAQQDAQEFLCELLDKVQNELERIDLGNSNTFTQTQVPASDMVSQIFQGQLVSQVTCLECHKNSKTYEPFMDLSLEFPDRFQAKDNQGPTAQDSCHLPEMLSKFTEVEKLEGKIYACEQCNSKRRRASVKPTVYTEVEKRILISKLPRVLRLHLKRFMWCGRNHRGKISAHVNFDQELDLRSFCHPDLQTDTYQYELAAVVIHHGRGFGSGHYTSYCWNEEAGSWVHCNDARLQHCPVSEVMQAQAYILFYILKPPKSAETFASITDSEEFEEEADEEITFNFINSTIPKYIEMKKRLSSEQSPPQTVLKRRRTTLW